MAPIIYKVWSTYPPALYKAGQDSLRIAAGTVSKIMVGDTPIPIDQPLPGSTTNAQLVWMRPAAPAMVGKPSTQKIAGSNGSTYILTTFPGGRQTCSCPGFTYRKTCKHLTK